MSKKRFILLRNIEGETRDSFMGASPLFRADIPAATRLEVEIADLDKHLLEVARHDARTIAMAPPMPAVLIKPVSNNTFAPVAASNAWGVEAVGAHTSRSTVAMSRWQ